MHDSLTDLDGLRVGAESVLAAVLEATGRPVCVVDSADVIRFANPPAVAALGYDRASDLVGRRSHDTLHRPHAHGSSVPAAGCPVLLPQATGQTVARELDHFFRRDGSSLPVSLVSVPLALPEGRGAVVAFTALDERLSADRPPLDTRGDSLRRIAALVARGAASADVFAAVAREAGVVVGLPLVVVLRIDPDQTTATVIGAWSEASHPFQTGTRWPVANAELTGTIAAAGRESGFGAVAGAPIIVDGSVWGAMTAASRSAAIPDHVQDRLAAFTELVATAISNTESRAALSRLAEEQAALRRVATLAAGGRPSELVFAAAAEEVGRLLGADLVSMARYEPDRTITFITSWGTEGHFVPLGERLMLGGNNLNTIVFETGRPARIDSYSAASGAIGRVVRKGGVRSAVGVPVIVDGHVWGMMAAGTAGPVPLPADTETRLAAFTELLATAIASAESRAGVARLAEEQAALRRMATLVAREVPAEELFAAVTEEVGQLPGAESARLARYEPDGTVIAVAAWGKDEDSPGFPVGGRPAVGGRNLGTLVFETGRPARVDDYGGAAGPGSVGLERGHRSSVGSPVVVERRLWGIVTVGSTLEQPLPADTEARLASFTELLATAIANAEGRARLGRLAEEHAALRRVATLVARGTRPEEVFAAVANEVARLLSVEVSNVCRYESDGTVTFVASAGGRFRVGSRWPQGEATLATLVSQTGRPARLDDFADTTGALADRIVEQGVRSAVATPIVVEGSLWGLVTAGSAAEQRLPPDTEERLASFTELVATAIANTDARSEVGRLADEQAALRRVATLVAEGAPPSEVFQTVTREVGILSGADLARMERYESEDAVIGVAGWSRVDAPELAVGTRFALEGTSIAAMVREVIGPVRVSSFAGAHGPIAQESQRLGIRSSVGCPIVVDGRLWGVIAASSKSSTPFPPDTESQIAEFTELVATAIANTEAQNELAASRARIVAATDDERRRVVRDLHDGAQQRLVHTVITLQMARQSLEREEDVDELLTEALENARRATAELRELAQGILPRILTQGGLRAAVDALASRAPVSVDSDVSVGRLPPAIEATAYFVVAEALTNVAKHARAHHAEVTAKVENGTLAVQVRDDGLGGAKREGTGLVGLADRLAVHDGQLQVENRPDGGTLVTATIPLLN